ncbi:hypothetical protein GCM10027180_03390 [Microbulbifer echini]
MIPTKCGTADGRFAQNSARAHPGGTGNIFQLRSPQIFGDYNILNMLSPIKATADTGYINFNRNLAITTEFTPAITVTMIKNIEKTRIVRRRGAIVIRSGLRRK